MESTRWYYDIQMNWGSFESQYLRDPKKVYEEEYVSAWTDDLRPAAHEAYREKLRPVNAAESNLYNITQTIAETFGIYCKYVYGYDENYHIISREIIFYNNYLNENNVMSFIYPYTANQVSREMDATDVVTKMFIRPQDNEMIVGGQINIQNSPCNGMREDYLLNFDYLYNIGAITKEQYEYIPTYQVAVRNLNIQLENLNGQILAQEQIKNDQAALEAIYDRSVALDTERLDYNTELYKKLADTDGNRDQYFSRVPANPYSTFIRKDTNGRYYIALNSQDKGINPSTIHIYRFFNSAKGLFKNEIPRSNFSVVNDEYNSPSEITLTNFSEDFELDSQFIQFNAETWSWQYVEDTTASVNNHSNSLLVYLVYKYQPVLYFDKINEIWIAKKNADQSNLDLARAAINTAEEQLKLLNKNYNDKLREKNELISKFERMMGPALREGYWQPEDYADYGNNKINTSTLNSNFNESAITFDFQFSDPSQDVSAIWDNQLFDDENKNYYEESVLREKVYYPCIRVTSSIMSAIGTWLKAGKTPAFIFNNNYFKTLDISANEDTLVENVAIFSLGSQMQLGFVAASSGSQVIPVLVLTGTETMTEDQIDFMKQQSASTENGGNPRLGIVTTNIVDSIARISIEEGYIALNDSSFLALPQNYFTVYPRLRLCSTDLNTESVVINYHNKLLTNYEDYAILSRNVVSGIETKTAKFEYLITIKPHVLFKDGTLNNTFNVAYTLSNAATCIYLDAQQVMADSSKPRASYTVNVNVLNIDYMNTLYKHLTQLVMINDTQLKFENTFGYISQLELNLDAPWEDKIEVKNYKTKFEDLFTTIVASSETMRQNAASFEAAAKGMIPLNQEALIQMVASNTNILQGYLDAGIGESAYVKAMLGDIFTEASSILVMSNDALNDIHSVTLKNAEILGGFVENISSKLTPRVFNSREQPERYKVGDIWNEVDAYGNVIGRHVATSNSDDSFHGFTKTYDGTLAQIRGAGMDLDAATGTVEIFARNQINIKSGGNIYIAANDRVDIVGNREVNIGGTTINIAAATDNGTVGGINIIATRYSNVKNAETNMDNTNSDIFAKVLIHPDKIELGSADIIMKGANKIQMITSRNTLESTSAISLNPDDGIWIGSGAGVTLYGGNVTLAEDEDNGGYIITGGSGASVEMIPEHLLFGVSNANSDSTAVKMTDEYIILATGNTLYHDAWQPSYNYVENDIVKFKSHLYKCTTTHTSDQEFDETKWEKYDADKNLRITGQISGLVGARFTKDSIGFATSTLVEVNGVNQPYVNAILMDNNGISIGSGINGIDLTQATNQLSGSFVRIASTGIDIGSNGHLFIDTTNFKLNSAATGTAPILGIYYSNGNSPALEYKQDGGLYVHGNIINDRMAFINDNNYSIAGTPYNRGLYITNSNITGTDKAISYNGEDYYAWHYNNRTYYCKHNSGTSVQAGSVGTILQYRKIINAVTPKYEPKAVVGYGPNDEYTYITYYIVDSNGNIVKDNSNNDIKYDGSSNPNAPTAYPNWYSKIPDAQKDNLVQYIETETGVLEVVSLDANATLNRNLNVTFSVIADSGLTTISTGRLGNFYVSPQGFTGGVITGSDITNTNLNGCMIENQYSTGYYRRCFYDYTYNRDTGILVLKRIDQTTETIDIKTAINVATTGGSTGDTSTPSSGGNSSGSGGGGSGCNGDCQGECLYTCSVSCGQDCTSRCVRTCKGSCTGGCTSGCTLTCSVKCTNNCSANCQVSCYTGCSEGCSGCTATCGGDCTGGCEGNCTAICGGSCRGGCSGSCSGGCTQGCTGGCRLGAGPT